MTWLSRRLTYLGTTKTPITNYCQQSFTKKYFFYEKTDNAYVKKLSSNKKSICTIFGNCTI